MQITINAQEIDEAIIAYVSKLGIDTNGKHVDVQMVAGRGANGFSANIEITKAAIQKDIPTPRSDSTEEVTEVTESTETVEEEGDTEGLF